MIKTEKDVQMNIAIIPARSGSKGLKDKNIKDLNGKPLLAYSIEAALDSRKFDKVFVSTDSSEYANIAAKYGADASFLRSEKNSGDKSGSWDVVREVIEIFESKGQHYDNIMLLQPTSPLRTAEDIINAFDLFENKKANAILSVTEMDHSPIWSNTLPEDGCMDNFVRTEYAGVPRQELPTYYRLNGAIYLLRLSELYVSTMFVNKCYAYVMPQNRSVDIDTATDFAIATALLNM